MTSKSVLTTEQLAAIGSIAVESAYLEDFVDFMIAWLAGLPDEQLSILIPRAMLDGKLDILRNLGIIKLRSKRRKEEFQQIIAKLKELNSQRNIAVHGNWQSKEMHRLSDIGKGIPVQIGNAEARGKKQNSVLHASKLQTVAISIADYREKLFHFCFDTWVNPSIRRSVARVRSKS